MSDLHPIIPHDAMDLHEASGWHLIYDNGDPGNSFSIWRRNKTAVDWRGRMGDPDTLPSAPRGPWIRRMSAVRLPCKTAHAMVEAARLLEGKEGAWIRYAARQWEKLTGQKPENP